MGAEFIHGDLNNVIDLVEEHNWGRRQVGRCAALAPSLLDFCHLSLFEHRAHNRFFACAFPLPLQIFTWSHGDGGPAVRPAPDGGNGYYFLGAEGRLLRSDDEDADFYNCNEALWGLGSVDAASADSDPRTLRQYLKDVGVTDAFMALADATALIGAASSKPRSNALA